MELKKIYRKAEALVSDGLIGSSDAEINKALPEAEAGMVAQEHCLTALEIMTVEAEEVQDLYGLQVQAQMFHQGTQFQPNII